MAQGAILCYYDGVENEAKNNDLSAYLPDLVRLFEKTPEIGVVYLFGSRAREDCGPRSDYDFAIYLNENDVVKRGDFRAALISDISGVLKTDAVDVLVINDLESPELKYGIIRDGVVLFEREPYRILLEPRILNEYFDFMYLLRKYNLTKA